METGTTPSPVCQAPFPYFFNIILNLVLARFLVHSLINILLNSWGHSIQIWGSPQAAILSVMSCPIDSSCSGLPGVLAPSPQLRKAAGVHFNTSFLCHSLGTLQRQQAGQPQGSHNLLPVPQGSPSFAVWSPVSWKPLLHAFYLFFAVSGRRLNSGLVTPCPLEAAFGHQVCNWLMLFTLKINAKK